MPVSLHKKWMKSRPLSSGKEIKQPGPKPARETREKEEVEPEHIFIKEDLMKESMPPPFP